MIRIVCIIVLLTLSLFPNRDACAQLQKAALDAKLQLDQVVTGNPAEVNQAFINNTVVLIGAVLNNLPESSEQAPALPSSQSQGTCVRVYRHIPIYGLFGCLRGYKCVETWEYRTDVPKKSRSSSSVSIRRAILEELTEIQGTLNVTTPAQSASVIELAKQALGLITVIQRRNLQ